MALFLELFAINLSVSSLLNVINLSKNTYSFVNSYNILTKHKCIEYINQIDLQNKITNIDLLLNKINIQTPLIEFAVNNITECTDEIKLILTNIYNNILTDFNKLEHLNNILTLRFKTLIDLLQINQNNLSTNINDTFIY